jgi:hypothetical protein
MSACAESDLGLYASCGAHVDNEARADGTFTAPRRLYNNREHAWVYMLNVNLHDLLA